MKTWKRVRIPTLTNLLVEPQVPLIHRDLSWLQFNERVLAEARPDNNPLLKKLKFLSISASNLDEFFMIRFASHVKAVRAAKDTNINRKLLRVHDSILDQVSAFTHKQAKTMRLLQQQLAAHKIYLQLNQTRNKQYIERSRAIFLEQVLPHLQLKNGFRFRQLKELRNLQMLVLFENRVWIEIPKNLPNVFSQVSTNNEEIELFFLDDLLLAHLKPLLKQDAIVFRITRDADFSVDLSDEDPESIPDIIKTSLGHRDRGQIVRLQVAGACPATVLETARKRLGLTERQVFSAPLTLCLHGLFTAVNALPSEIILRPGFNNPPLRSMIPRRFQDSERAKIFNNLQKHDIVLHHPYDSFDAFVNFIRAACEDPFVTSIEQTIYRTDSYSRVMELLKSAAKKKKIRVMLELRARFDEWNNLNLAEELRKAGVEVSFGFGQLKLHAKITLITRKENGKDILYTHLSTGNYNAKTAQAYTDIGIFTANQEIGVDARHFFNAIMTGRVPSTFKHLVTAPTKLHEKIKTLIHSETQAALRGERAHIVAKVNALVDTQIIEDLYNASCAGVKVDLIVRGACSLVPGIPGLSENIRVISIVDRFLEHSRIYYFANAKRIYLSSADWMPRNFFSRLEIAFPVLDQRIYNYIVDTVLPIYLADTVKAKELSSVGLWRRIQSKKGEPPMRAQSKFEELASNEYKETSLYENLNSRSSRAPR